MTNGLTLNIDKIGSSGDGVAAGPDGPVYVPYTLPGEVVVASIEGQRGRLIEVLEPAPDRAAPVCQHFTQCGGCACQHMSKPTYTDWKRSVIVSALANRGIETEIADTINIGHGGRRKAVLVATRGAGMGVSLGFHKEGSGDIIDLKECPVLDEKIVAMLPRLRTFVEPLFGVAPSFRVNILNASNGLDINVSGLPQKLPRGLVARLAGDAAQLGAIRVTLDQDLLFSSKAPIIRCGPAELAPPAGVFLQASRVAEEEMAALIVDALPKRVKKIADLFCGLGAFSFPLATRAPVTAMDEDARAIEALRVGMSGTKGVKPIDSKVRDLFAEPLSRKELTEFDAVVFDPPRAGAKSQVENLAKSKVPVVIGVSCNPATFARDARTLIDGGYMLQKVTPIDQFVYAAHVELVAVFRR